MVRDDQFTAADELAEQWMQRWPELVGVVLNIQPKPGNTLLGQKERLLAGRPWLMESFAGCRFQIGLGTFFQVHHQQAESLVDALRSELQLQSGDVLVDAYCGVGTLGLPLLQEGVRLIGLEQSRDSIERAQCNALLNGLENTDFHAGAVNGGCKSSCPSPMCCLSIRRVRDWMHGCARPSGSNLLVASPMSAAIPPLWPVI